MGPCLSQRWKKQVYILPKDNMGHGSLAGETFAKLRLAEIDEKPQIGSPDPNLNPPAWIAPDPKKYKTSEIPSNAPEVCVETVPSSFTVCRDDGTVADLSLPILVKTKLKAKEKIKEEEPEPTRSNTPDPVWDASKSVFKARIRDSDSRSVFDTDRLFKRTLNADWKRMMKKSGITRLMAKTDDDEEELAEVKEVLGTVYCTYCRAFDWYGGQDFDSPYTIGMNEFSEFLRDCNIPEKKSKTCRMSDLDSIFIVANYEEDKKSAESKINANRSLMRFEFLESLIRIAIAKYIKSGITDDLSEAIQKLETDIVSGIDPGALHDPNAWRRNRLYTLNMEEMMRPRFPFIKALFFKYAQDGAEKKPRMTMAEWTHFCKDVGFFDSVFSFREASLAFLWGKMRAIDEIRKRSRWIALSLEDFAEALGRVADMKTWPSRERFKQVNVPDCDLVGYMQTICKAHLDGRPLTSGAQRTGGGFTQQQGKADSRSSMSTAPSLEDDVAVRMIALSSNTKPGDFTHSGVRPLSERMQMLLQMVFDLYDEKEAGDKMSLRDFKHAKKREHLLYHEQKYRDY